MNLRYAGLMLTATALFAGGCSDRDLRALNPCTVTGVVEKISQESANDVDLLLMVDNSKSMAEEQAALAAEIPRMVEALVTGQSGDQIFPPVESLRVGVVTSDMGILGYGVVTSPKSGTVTTGVGSCGGVAGSANPERVFFGDDGKIQLVSGPGADASCPASFPSFLQFTKGGDADQFIANVACTAAVGKDGCAFEMQLESVLAAVTDSNRAGAPTFRPNIADDGAPRDRIGQATAGQANAGFFREGSVKAIVLLTDEEDCSTADREVFWFLDTETDLYDAPNLRVNTRCLHYQERLYEIQRYVDGILALDPDPNRIIFAGIVGVPLDLDGTEDFDELLADPRMTYTDRFDGGGVLIDNNAQVFAEPACYRCIGADGSTTSVASWEDCPDVDITTTPEDELATANEVEALQWAAPGRRYVDLAKQLEAKNVGSVIRSICAESYTPAMDSILKLLIDVLRGACLPRSLNPDAEGRVNCDVVEILPEGETCAQRADEAGGRDPVRVRLEDGREVCRVEQLVASADDKAAGTPPDGNGWFYDDFSTVNQTDCPGKQRIGFVGSAPADVIRLECLQPVQGGGLAGPDIFEPCRGNPTACDWSTADEADEFIVRYNLNRGSFISNGAVTNQALFCSEPSGSCQIGCTDSSQCPGGFVCFDPDTDGTNMDCSNNSGANGCYCVNPTCSLSGGGESGDASPDAGT